MAEMSESTLDTVLATIESLKAVRTGLSIGIAAANPFFKKISEHRAQREKQRRQLGEQLEKEKRSDHLI